MFVKVLIFLAFQYFVDCAVKIDQILYDSNPRFGIFKLVLEHKGNESFMSGGYQQSVDLTRETVTITVQNPEDDDGLDFRRTMFRSTIDLCEISNNKKNGIMAKAYLDHFVDKIDFAWKCPFKKGNYTINNVKIMSDQYINGFQLKVLQTKFSANGTARGIVKGSRGMKYLYSWKFYVSLY